MTPSARKALTIGGVAVGVLLLLGGVANAAEDDDEDDDDDDGNNDEDDIVIVEPPVLCPPGQVNVNGVCVTPPPPPDPTLCNYVGCGPEYSWPWRDEFPFRNERDMGTWLQQQGYIINPAAANFSIVSPYSRAVVRQFQRDYNVARTAQTVEPTPPALATDGLIGDNTIRAIRRATQWVNTLGLPWLDIVALG